jgi:hypothetical protein
MWNAAAVKENRPPQVRDYIYASELMYPKIDRWLKMNGVEYTNPPNDRSLRKFFAGNVWEYVVKSVLLVCGVYQREEVKADAVPYEGGLSVHGRLDFIAGGYVDGAEARAKLKEHNFPDFLELVAEKVISSLEGRQLDRKILELKSVSMYALEYVEKRRAAMATHTGQAYHYQKNTGIPAEIAYVSKDTALIAQFGINVAEAEPLYREDVLQMSYYYMKHQQPPTEPLYMFDPSIGKFSKHLGVEYSPYLTMLYGFKSPDEYRRAVEPTVLSYNNVLTRYAKAERCETTPTGKPIQITPKNKEIRQQIEASGYDFNELLAAKMAIMDGEDEMEEEA